jgi:hypothetical protein
MKAQERRVRLQKLKGELVDRSHAIATVFGLARRERDAWVQWPARVAALIAAELGVDPHAVETALRSMSAAVSPNSRRSASSFAELPEFEPSGSMVGAKMCCRDASLLDSAQSTPVKCRAWFPACFRIAKQREGGWT